MGAFGKWLIKQANVDASLTTSRIGNHTRLMPDLLKVMTTPHTQYPYSDELLQTLVYNRWEITIKNNR